MTIRVERTTVGDATFASVGRLRYAVYAEEEHQTLTAMDHGRRTLVDTLDPTSFVYAAIDEGVVVGTLRLTPMAALPRDDAHDLRLRTPYLPVPEAEQLFAGRLMVASSHRGGPVCRLLFAAAHREALANGFAVVHAECSPRNLPLYEAMGYRVSGPPYCDAIYGLNVRLILFLHDSGRFPRRRPVLRAPACTRGIDPFVEAWADRNLAPWTERFSLRLKGFATQQRLFAEIDALPDSPFAGLSAVDLRHALRSASVFELDESAEILRPDSSCTEAFLVMDGEVRLTAGDEAGGEHATVVCRGGIFNETALLQEPRSTTGWSAVASKSTRLLVLSAESFARLRRSRGTIANAIDSSMRLLRKRIPLASPTSGLAPTTCAHRRGRTSAPTFRCQPAGARRVPATAVAAS